MKHPVTGEHATPLTQPMLDALFVLRECNPTPHFCPNQKVAVALLNRGWIMKASTGEHVNTRTLYHITTAGERAYAICSRAPGVREPLADMRPDNSARHGGS